MQQVGVKYYTCNFVARKMHNIKKLNTKFSQHVVENSGNWQSSVEKQTDNSAFRIHFMQLFVQMADKSCVFLKYFSSVLYRDTVSCQDYIASAIDEWMNMKH